MPAITIKITKTDYYSGSIFTVEKMDVVCDCVPKIGEKVSIKGTDWYVLNVIHSLNESTKMLWTTVVVG